MVSDELLAVIPDPQILQKGAKDSFLTCFQQALETIRSTESATWSDSESHMSGSVTPLLTVKIMPGLFGRKFRIDMISENDSASYYGFSIRNEKGKWIIPERFQ